jgi:hypothetical protein
LLLLLSGLLLTAALLLSGLLAGLLILLRAFAALLALLARLVLALILIAHGKFLTRVKPEFSGARVSTPVHNGRSLPTFKRLSLRIARSAG